jgi:hypothetical protein
MISVEKKLITVYSIAYRYQVQLILQYARQKPHQVLRNIFMADDWKAMLKDIEDEVAQVNEAIYNISFVHLKTILKEIDEKIQRSTAKVLDLGMATLRQLEVSLCLIHMTCLVLIHLRVSATSKTCHTCHVLQVLFSILQK